jgi:serine/threonine-protein kinase HipA
MNPHKVKLAMKIGGEYRLKYIGRRQWEKLAAELGLEGDRVVARVREIGEALPDAMSEAAADPSVRAIDSALPQTLVDALADRVSSRLPFLHD